jgi:hypothetical protein
MSGEYRARSEDWAGQEAWAPDDTNARCLLELLSRVEALEQRCKDEPPTLQESQAKKAHYEAELARLKCEAMQQPASVAPPPLRCPGAHTIAECGGPCEADFRLCDCGLLQQLNPAPAGGLVERLARIIEPDDPLVWRGTCGLILREVAAWLRGREGRHTHSSVVIAGDLEQEADR